MKMNKSGGKYGRIARMGEIENVYKIVAGKSEEQTWKAQAWMEG
jgi:hypothetical protein